MALKRRRGGRGRGRPKGRDGVAKCIGAGCFRDRPTVIILGGKFFSEIFLIDKESRRGLAPREALFLIIVFIIVVVYQKSLFRVSVFQQIRGGDGEKAVDGWRRGCVHTRGDDARERSVGRRGES